MEDFFFVLLGVDRNRVKIGHPLIHLLEGILVTWTWLFGHMNIDAINGLLYYVFFSHKKFLMLPMEDKFYIHNKIACQLAKIKYYNMHMQIQPQAFSLILYMVLC